MGSYQQPFLYNAVGQDARSPTKPFDPKAVTRASYMPKPERPKSDGPLISVNRHPDAHMVIMPRRSNLHQMSNTTKKWVVAMRYVQLALRVLELNGAVGVLILMILVSNVDTLFGWVMRITPGVIMLHTAYAIYHLSRSAGGRTPGSSAAYHVFAGVSDICVGPIYAYGVLTIRNTSTEWTTLLSNQHVLNVLIPALYYTLIGAGGLHVLSLAISLWLGVMFRRISLMPPDLNPLEDRFTSRAHKRNKSSVSTFKTISEGEKRLSVKLEDRRRSGAPYESLSRPPSIPFMHTRQGSNESLNSARDPRTSLPSRQSYMGPGSSPRNSATHLNLNQYAPGSRGSPRGSYVEVPLHDADSSRPPSSTTLNNSVPSPHSQKGRFTEAWYASESLINRTQQRNRAMMKTASTNNVNASNTHIDSTATSSPPSPTKNGTPRHTYETLSQRYDFPVSDESDTDNDSGTENHALSQRDGRVSQDAGGLQPPNPLRSNPFAKTPPRTQTPYRPNRSSALSEVTYSDRNVSGASKDIVDDQTEPLEVSDDDEAPSALPLSLQTGKGHQPAVRGTRLSSIQPESAFYSKPYGELKAATPPIIVGSGRQVSSGNDFESSGGVKAKARMFERRNVSGKIAEEGRARTLYD